MECNLARQNQTWGWDAEIPWRSRHSKRARLCLTLAVAARQNAQNGGYQNVEFRLGEIEYLPVADDSVDIIISNCVINLSLDKDKVFQEAFPGY